MSHGEHKYRYFEDESGLGARNARQHDRRLVYGKSVQGGWVRTLGSTSRRAYTLENSIHFAVLPASLTLENFTRLARAPRDRLNALYLDHFKQFSSYPISMAINQTRTDTKTIFLSYVSTPSALPIILRAFFERSRSWLAKFRVKYDPIISDPRLLT